MPGSRTRSIGSAIGAYAGAVVFVAAALGIWQLLGRILPFTFFLGAVALSAWFFGTRVGLFALVLSLAVLDVAVARGAQANVANLTRLVTFTSFVLLVVWLIAARRSAELALRKARDELDERVRERTASLARTNEQLHAEIDERERSEQRLAAAAVRLTRTRRRARERVLEARFTAMLEERTRLAREIHDTLLQGFTGVSLQLLAATVRLSGPPELQASLREVLALAQKTLADARQAVWDMRPPALEGDDFVVALRATLDRALADHAIAFDFIVRGATRALDTRVETVVYRVAQEAVANVVKHADAHTVKVVLSYGRQRVRLVVADDGRGFAVHPDLHSYAGHWGLLGMRERASQLRGQLAVRSAPGAGTKVVLYVPNRLVEEGVGDAKSPLASSLPSAPSAVKDLQRL